jgi:Divergent InlB B-repeat domain
MQTLRILFLALITTNAICSDILKPKYLPAPTNVIALAGNGQATIQWFPSQNAFFYTATSSPGSFQCSPTPAFDTTCDITGLQNGVTYTFTVIARSPLEAITGPGTSSPSTASNPVTPSSDIINGGLISNVGVCGFASNSTSIAPPTSALQLCLLGAPSSLNAGPNGSFTWICSGSTSPSVNCSSLPVYPSPNMTLNVVLSTAAPGQVTSDPPGINYAPLAQSTVCPAGSAAVCGTTNSYRFTKNQSVTLLATSVNGSQFNGWGGGCSGKKLTCSIKLKKNTTVTAKFK